MNSKDEKLKSVLDSSEKDFGNLGLLLAIIVGLVTLGNLFELFSFYFS